LEGPDIDGRIILKWIFRNWNEGKDWIDLAPQRDRWRALINAFIKPYGYTTCGEFLD
jgi:hypothetical protein